MKNVQVKMLSVKDINTPSYSLLINKKVVDLIAKNFKQDIFGTLTVCQRDNEYCVIDGQHRLAAAVILGFDEVSCVVIKAESIREETELFLKANTVTTKHSINSLRKIKSILQKYDMQFS